MNEKELRKLNRSDLLEILVMQGKEIERLEAELKAANKIINDRKIEISKVGTLAEAALKLNKVFEAADEAAKQYLENVKMQNPNVEESTKKKRKAKD